MDDRLRAQLKETRNLKGEERERALLALAEKNESAQVFNELGNYYKEIAADQQKAIDMFEKALSITKDAAIYNNLGSAYFNLAQQERPERKEYMKKTEEAFQHSV